MKTPNIEGKYKRKAMMADGAYDGRFKNRVVGDKKKNANKNACRQINLDH